ncbi:dentin sialophosphoprotein-like isoform X2 [Ptychodera flava]
MKKLDKILDQKIKREKEVKRQRLQLQRQMQEELERAKPEGREELKEAKENTMKFLALAPPPHHNEGINIDDISPPVTPLFATQPNISSRDGGSTDRSDRSRTSNTSESKASSAGASSRSAASSRDSRPNTHKKSAGTGANRKGNKTKSAKGDARQNKKDGADFIKRNIDLASDAGNVIAMTDDEKKRLEELLGDVEMLKEDNEENANFNPFALQITPGLGFRPDEQEQKELNDIDARLQALLPREDFESICSTPRRANFENSEFSFSQKEYAESLDLMQLGERALRDTKETRDQQTRLKEIEDELTHLQLRVESEMEYPRLTDQQLQDLLDLCSQASSRATQETNAIALSPRSPSQASSPASSSVPVNSPKLPDDILRKLLSDARQELQISSSRLSMVREESESRASESILLTDRSREVDGPETVNERDITLESLSVDTIQELLQNPRATSRALSRSSQDDQTPTPQTPGANHTDTNQTDNGAFTENSDSNLDTASEGFGNPVFTPRRKLPTKKAQRREKEMGRASQNDAKDSLGRNHSDTGGVANTPKQGKDIQSDRGQTSTDDEIPDEKKKTEEEEEEEQTPRNDDDDTPTVEDLEEDAVQGSVMSVSENHLSWQDALPVDQVVEEGYPDEEIESDIDDEDDFGLNDDESLESELRALQMGTPSTVSRASSHMRTESGMSIKELRISKSAFDSRPSSKANSHGTPVTPEPVPKPPSKASSLKMSARSFQSVKKGQATVHRSDPLATASRAASETSTLRSDSADTLVESSDFDYEHDAEIREQLLQEDEHSRVARERWQRQHNMGATSVRSTQSFAPTPTPHPPNTGRKSKGKNSGSRKMSSKNGDDEERTFSPPLL